MSYRRIGSVVAFLVLLALVAPFAAYAVPGVIGADHSFVVLSGSMEPEIAAGDVVIVEETDPSTIETGDVVTFVRSDEDAPVTHRVIAVEQRDGEVAFETKGDANDDPDSQLVSGENVLGTVVLTIPFMGYVIQFANTSIGFALLVGLPLGLLVLSEVWLFVNDGSSASRSADVRPSSDEDSIDDEPAASERDDEVTVHVMDLTTTLGVLALLTPYSIYVALQLWTTVTITIAFAVSFSTLGLATLWLSARLARDGEEEPTTAEPSREGSEDAVHGGDVDSRSVDVEPDPLAGVEESGEDPATDGGSGPPIEGRNEE